MPTGEALARLLTELAEQFGEGADRREVEFWLASRGYDARQIDAILADVAAHLASGAGDGADAGGGGPGTAGEAAESAAPGGLAPGEGRPVGPLRVAAPYERARFSPDAWGHLLQLRAVGVTGVEFEQLVDRALMHIDGRIGLDDLRALIEGSGGPERGAIGPWTVH